MDDLSVDLETQWKVNAKMAIKSINVLKSIKYVKLA